jgi:toxin FitB
VTGYLLDTNVVSELRKPKPHGGVLAWLSALSPPQLLLSAVTIGKLQAGVEGTRRQDPDKAFEIESWIDQLAGCYEVLPMDALCFREWARLMQRKPDQLLEDMMIAATARVHNLTLATRNQRDFAGIDLQLINPFARQEQRRPIE